MLRPAPPAPVALDLAEGGGGRQGSRVSVSKEVHGQRGTRAYIPHAAQRQHAPSAPVRPGVMPLPRQVLLALGQHGGKVVGRGDAPHAGQAPRQGRAPAGKAARCDQLLLLELQLLLRDGRLLLGRVSGGVEEGWDGGLIALALPCTLHSWPPLQ